MDGDFDLSMRITGDASGAVDAAEKTSVAALSLEAAQAKAAVAADKLSAAQDRLAAAAGNSTEAQRQAASGLAAAQLSAAQASLQLEKAQVRANDSLHAGVESSGRASVASLEAEHSIRAFTDAINAGQSPVRALALELPRLTESLSFMGGEAGSIGAFFAGPWGIALTVAGSVAAGLLPKLLDNGDALAKQATLLDQVVKAADSFGAAQSALGKIVDLTTGKFKTQNEVLIQSVKLQAQLGVLQAGEAAKKDTKALASQAAPSFLDSFLSSGIGAGGTAGGGDTTGDAALAAQRAQAAALAPLKVTLDAFAAVANDPNASPKAVGAALDAASAKVDVLAASGKLAGKNLIDVKKALISLGTDANDKTANQQIIDVLNGGAIPADLKPYQRARQPRAAKKVADPTSIFNGIDNEALGDIRSYSDAPTFLTKANDDLTKLQQGVEKINKTPLRPGNDQDLAALKKTVGDIQSAFSAISAGLDKPYTDFLRSQNESLQVTKLQVSGSDEQAEALRDIISLQKQGTVLDDAHVQGVIDSVNALHKAQDAYALIKQQQSDLASGLDSYRTILEGVFTGAEKLRSLPNDLITSFKQVAGKLAFDNLFGKAFQDLGNQISGNSGLTGATAELKAAIAAVAPPASDFANTINKVNALVASLGDAIGALTARITGAAAPSIADSSASSAYNLGGLTPSLNQSLSSAAADTINARLRTQSACG